VAANGAIYDFNAEGEFMLAAATQPGDSLDVQVRLESFNNSPYASSVTQVGAQLGTNRITFGTGRSDTFWVDGSAAAIGASGMLAMPWSCTTSIVRWPGSARHSPPISRMRQRRSPHVA
jgi:hypothetical protein